MFTKTHKTTKTNKTTKTYKTSQIVFDVLNYIFFTFALIVCIYPFYYILIYSLSDPVEALKGVYLLPKKLTLDNYVRISALKGILNSAVVSTLRTVIGTVVTVLCCSFLAYLVTKKEMYFRKIIYRMLVVTLYFNAGLIPWYLTMKMYHLNNNFLLYILPHAISAYYVILIKTYIEQIPPAMEESAKIDGASYPIIFLKVIFPLSMPIIATIAVFSAVSQWNTWVDNYFLVENPRLRTLQLVLYYYLSEANRIATSSARELSSGEAVKKLSPQAIKMTITMVVILPIIFVYPFLQRYFVKGIMMGAIKG